MVQPLQSCSVMRLSHILPFVALVLTSAIAQADEGSAKDPQVARLLEAKRSLSWTQTLPGHAERYGHAEALVAAPADKVAAVAADFGQYFKLHKKFASTRVVATGGATTDVFMRYPVYVGPLTLQFNETVRFSPMQTRGNVQVLEATHVDGGDMKQGHLVITVKPVDNAHSIVGIDVLFTPKMSAPQAILDRELRGGAQNYVDGLRDLAQGRSGAVTAL